MTKILFFSAHWCSSCNNLKQNLLPEDLENVEFVDADNQPNEVIKYNIRSIPTLIKLDEEGDEIDRKLGTMTRSQFIEWAGE